MRRLSSCGIGENQSGQALFKRESGQALLIVLLSMAVVLTIVLSILSFSVTDVAISSREEEALRAFSAAEAGIEKSLLAGTGSIGSFEAASFDAAVTNVGEGAKTFVYPQGLALGDTATVWFVSHADTSGFVCSAEKPCFTGSQIKVCWGRSGTSDAVPVTPALEASVVYLATPGDYSSARIARAAIDPNASRRGTNLFAAPSAGGCVVEGNSYAFQTTLDFSTLGILPAVYNVENGLQYMTVKLLYNTTTAHGFGVDVNFAGATLLPSQGDKIVSTGTAGEATRKVEVFRLFSNLPTAFNSVLFISGGITK